MGPLAKRHLNGISLACRWWPHIECWLGSFVIFQRIRINIAKKSYIFVIFQGGFGPTVPSILWIRPCKPPYVTRMQLLDFYQLYRKMVCSESCCILSHNSTGKTLIRCRSSGSSLFTVDTTIEQWAWFGFCLFWRCCKGQVSSWSTLVRQWLGSD